MTNEVNAKDLANECVFTLVEAFLPEISPGARKAIKEILVAFTAFKIQSPEEAPNWKPKEVLERLCNAATAHQAAEPNIARLGTNGVRAAATKAFWA